MSAVAAGKKTTDVHGVAALLRTLLSEGQDEQAIELVVGLLTQLVEKNTELELRLRKALRQHFGRTSEKLSAEQLSLFLSELGQQQAGAGSEATAAAAEDAAPAQAQAPRAEQHWKKRKGHGRNPAAAYTGAERVAVPHESLHDTEACPVCQRGKVYLLPPPAQLVRVGSAPAAIDSTTRSTRGDDGDAPARSAAR